MSTIFNHVDPLPEKPVTKHPWETRMKDIHLNNMKYAHNSVSSNPIYPKNTKKPHGSKAIKNKFTVIGSRCNKEFLYCKHVAQKLHYYRTKVFEEPLIKGVTTIQWPQIWNDLKLKYGGLAYCLNSPVVVLINDNFLGGIEDFKKYVGKKYRYYYRPDYFKESVKEFANLINSTTRPFIYMHFSIDNKHIGTMIFMLYTDIVPETCANFIRLCCQTRGGYAGTPVHRVVKDCWIQCGGFALKDTDMKCENFIVDFDQRGVLGMANADRHVDCSSQFFIISQPAQWMKTHYVAFGQLIDGNSTLELIEQVPTWYESPTQDIRIEHAGVLNLDCDYIPVNKNTHAYIDGHIENLFEIGEVFTEMLMEKVFGEILLRYLMSLEVNEEEEALIKNEQIEISEYFLAQKLSKTSIEKALSGVDDNDQFDVESYEPEEYLYDQVLITGTESPIIKPFIPVYISPTDVSYPDEVDSTFDLKRYLQGKYCLEADLDTNFPKKKFIPIQASSKIFFPEINIRSSSSSSESSLDSDEQMALTRMYSETVSFSGPTIKALSKSLDIDNVMNLKKINAHITDEQLRRLRLVSMDVPASHVDRKVKRRLTGFIRDEDLHGLIAKISVSQELITSSDDGGGQDSDSDIMLGTRRIHILRDSVKPTSIIKSVSSNKAKEPPRSTIQRLWEEVDISETEIAPKLKDFRPPLEVPALKQNYLTPSQKIVPLHDSQGSSRKRSSSNIGLVREENRVQVLPIVESMEAVQKSSVLKAPTEQSIRTLEFSKTRPSISVTEYKKLNKKRDGKPPTITESKLSGLRLPGDSPLYSMSDVLVTEKYEK